MTATVHQKYIVDMTDPEPTIRSTDMPWFSDSQDLYDTLPLGLDSNEIRVFDVHAGGSFANAPITGTLRIVDLRASPHYTALSYTCGPMSCPCDVVVCNGSEIEVSANCAAALKALRRLFGALTIWVDAISINQRNQREKEDQLRAIGRVYTYAQPTYIWLGDATRSTDRAMAYIEACASLRMIPAHVPWFEVNRYATISDDRVKMLKEFWRICKMRFLGYKWKMFGDYCEPFTGLRDYKEDISLLLANPWIGRVWTFQEAILSCNSLVVCGGKTVSWSSFAQGVDVLYDGEPAMGGNPRGLVPSRSVRGPNRLSQLPDNSLAWVHVTRFWMKFPRPMSWNGRKLRAGPTDGVWTADEHQARYSLRLIKVVICLLWSWFGLILLTPLFIMQAALNLDDPAQYLVIGAIVLHSLVQLAAGMLAIPRRIHLRSDLGHLFEVKSRHRYNTGTTDKMLLAHAAYTVSIRAASEPRDKVFALHSVLEGLGVHIPPPNYSKPLHQTYLDLFTGFLAKSTRCVSLLVVAGRPKLDSPSWVPRFDIATDLMWFDDSFLSALIEKYPLGNEPLASIDGAILRVRGHLHGRITFVTGPLLGCSPVADDSGAGRLYSDASECTMLLKLCEWISAGTPTTSLLDILLVESIKFGEHIKRGEEIVWTDRRCESNMAWKWLALVEHHLLLKVGYKTERLSRRELLGFLNQHPAARGFLSMLRSNLSSKRGLIYSTEAGYGSAGFDTQIGDVVATVVGVALPLVLREKIPGSSRYVIVGPAIFDGIPLWKWASCTKPGHLFIDQSGMSHWDPPEVLQDYELFLGRPSPYDDMGKFVEISLM